MADWIVLGCAAGAAAISTYMFFGAYHYRWRRMRDRSIHSERNDS